LITDPWFYAVAIPAVLLTGLSKSGFASGFGSLAVPLMALAIPVPQAVAIMLPLLAVMDATGLVALWRERDRTLLRLLVPAGLCGIVLGTLLFRVMSPPLVATVVGATTLAFLAIRRLHPPRADAPPPPRWRGWLLGTMSGFTSFIAHAGSPPVAFYVLPLRLSPVQFTATMAVFFAAINASKWIPYAALGLIDLPNMSAALVLMPLAPLGVWAGARLVRLIRPVLFYGLFEIGMLLTGLKLLHSGLWQG
jgi:uncharacterized protein